MKVVLSDMMEIRNRVEKAPRQELFSNTKRIKESLLKADRENGVYVCIESASLFILASGATLLFSPKPLVKIAGIGMSVTGCIGAFLARRGIRKKEEEIKNLNEIQEVIDDELQVREAIEK